MSLIKRVGWRRGVLALALTALLSVAAIQALSGEPEIALMIGEPWEDMRKRSSAAIDPAIPGHFWGRLPKSDARLRFIDPQYGFVTPLAWICRSNGAKAAGRQSGSITFHRSPTRHNGVADYGT